MNKLSRGFTLFEILIVVVIIGILATVLIASLDPLEAIRKTNDTAMITALTNIQNSFATYSANEGAKPWNNGNGICDLVSPNLTYGYVADITAGNFASAGNIGLQMAGSTAAEGCISQVVSKNYLKSSVLGALNATRRLRVFFTIVRDTTNGDKLIMCFRPESRDIKKQMNWGLPAQSNLTTFTPNAAAGSIYGPKDAAATNGLWCTF